MSKPIKHETPEDLVNLYESTYLNPQANQNLVSEKSDTDEVEDEDVDETQKSKTKPKPKTKKKVDVGAELYNDSFTNQFASIMEQFYDDDDYDDDYDDVSFDDESEGFEADDDFDIEDEEEEVISISKSKIRGIIDQLNELLGEVDSVGLGDGDDFDDTTFESYGFSGDGNKGGNVNYDGKAKPQKKSNFVKDNGDADFSKQDTGYDPEDTEGQEGSIEGDGDYDGKAKPQPRSTHVQSNGNANVNRSQKTGHRPNTPKQNYF